MATVVNRNTDTEGPLRWAQGFAGIAANAKQNALKEQELKQNKEYQTEMIGINKEQNLLNREKNQNDFITAQATAKALYEQNQIENVFKAGDLTVKQGQLKRSQDILQSEIDLNNAQAKQISDEIYYSQKKLQLDGLTLAINNPTYASDIGKSIKEIDNIGSKNPGKKYVEEAKATRGWLENAVNGRTDVFKKANADAEKTNAGLYSIYEQIARRGQELQAKKDELEEEKQTVTTINATNGILETLKGSNMTGPEANNLIARMAETNPEMGAVLNAIGSDILSKYSTGEITKAKMAQFALDSIPDGPEKDLYMKSILLDFAGVNSDGSMKIYNAAQTLFNAYSRDLTTVFTSFSQTAKDNFTSTNPLVQNLVRGEFIPDQNSLVTIDAVMNFVNSLCNSGDFGTLGKLLLGAKDKEEKAESQQQNTQSINADKTSSKSSETSKPKSTKPAASKETKEPVQENKIDAEMIKSIGTYKPMLDENIQTELDKVISRGDPAEIKEVYERLKLIYGTVK